MSPRLGTRREEEMSTQETVAITCIACPQGCATELRVEDGEVVAVTGARCQRGKEYVLQEFIKPERVLTSTVPLQGGGWLPVRSRGMVPKNRIFDVMAVLRRFCQRPPVQVGDVVVPNVLGLGVDVVACASRGGANEHGGA